ncbi:unnamed protein product [Lactuca virosa]|uniref:Glucose-6-phosphate isomerase n=1 Tax=Lactuca virosa TaxID=75947 RepID=A0AAU9MT61_9ASTR|nr:unnamed protein product [Lactuca virosa]
MKIWQLAWKRKRRSWQGRTWEVGAHRSGIASSSGTPWSSGFSVGATGKPLTNVIVIGIGGSFLGPLFVHTAVQTDPEASKSAGGHQLRLCSSF